MQKTMVVSVIGVFFIVALVLVISFQSNNLAGAFSREYKQSPQATSFQQESPKSYLEKAPKCLDTDQTTKTEDYDATQELVKVVKANSQYGKWLMLVKGDVNSINFKKKGILTAFESNGTTIKSDYCSLNKGVSSTKSCKDNCQLIEQTCNFQDTYPGSEPNTGFVRSIVVSCPQGCTNGACPGSGQPIDLIF